MTWKIFIGPALGAIVGYGLSFISMKFGST